jgi:uncharacterized SAM-binding protein YcdF (DUF218 family)
MGSEGVRKEPPALTPAQKPVGRRGRRLRRLLLVAFVVSLVLLYVGRNRALPALARFLDVSESAQKTDYVMVLGGDVQSRPFAAAAFLHVGLARKALVDKIKADGDSLDGIVADEQKMIRAVLVAQGAAPDAVVMLNRECASTFDEACSLAEFLESEPQSTVTVMTSCYHTRRVRMIFCKILGERAARVRFMGAPTDGFNESNWWCFESGLLAYLNEYFKLAFYLVRY